MDKKNNLDGRVPFVRKLAQLYAALLYNANIKGFIDGKIFTGKTKGLCVPGLNCYSCPGAVAACPLGSLQNALASSGHTAPWYMAGILLLFGLLLGRTVCGWFCPAGLIQEALHKIPAPKIRKSRATRILSYLKYVILGIFAAALPLFYGLRENRPLPAFCKYICPVGTLEGAVSLLSHPGNEGMMAQLGFLFTWKFVLMLGIGLMCVFCYRFFCRFLCPLGAVYSLFNRFALTGVTVDEGQCIRCGSCACMKVCKMDVRRVGDHECISCGECIGQCPAGAVSLKCGNTGVLTKEKMERGKSGEQKNKRLMIYGFPGLILILILLWVNVAGRPEAGSRTEGAEETVLSDILPETTPEAEPLPDSVEETNEEADGSVPTGVRPGERMADFSCTLLDGTTFNLSDYRGRVVVVNQWATYCTPCVDELPHFEKLQEDHPDIVVLAFHHWLEAKPAAADYIEEKGWTDWKIRFALDSRDKTILTAIGGDNTMPRTVVLNGQGEIVYNEQRSVSLDMLAHLVEIAKSGEENATIKCN